MGGQVSGEVASATAIRAILKLAAEMSSWIMRPSEAELAEARAALAAFAEAGGKVIRHNGKMLEAPVIKRFEAMLDSKGKDNA